MVPGGFSCFLIAPGLVFMIPGGFLSSLMVPGWFKSELSAAGAKWDIENTPKGTHLIYILAPQSRWALPAIGRLWPSDDDDEDDDVKEEEDNWLVVQVAVHLLGLPCPAQ